MHNMRQKTAIAKNFIDILLVIKLLTSFLFYKFLTQNCVIRYALIILNFEFLSHFLDFKI